jgi:tripartite-type tricarboxylate transporter receptor subunit TctC
MAADSNDRDFLVTAGLPCIKKATAMQDHPHITRRHHLHGLARGACLATVLPTLLPLRQALAQDFPSRPVKLLLGFAPGGSGDFVARALADDVGRLLGQPLVIENRPGAATNLASEAVARAAPDGYTLLLGGSFSHSVNPTLFSKLSFDPVKDFVPICKVASLPTVFAVPASLPVNSLREFMAYAKTQTAPGGTAGDKLSYASAGIGSPGHIAGGYFNQRAGLQMLHVPYKGGSDAVRALLGGEVQLTITSPPAIMSFVKAGRAKALALTTPGRTPLVPGVPGADEAGLPDFNLNGWYGLWAPAGTPAAAVGRLFAAFTQVLALPAIVERFESQGAAPDPSPSPEAFARWAREDAARWVDIVKKSGATVA